jgi:hypothetical protein
VLLGLAASLTTSTADADYVVNYGVLTCDGNRALIRFTMAPNGAAPDFPDPPDEIDLGLSSLPRIDGNVCRLSDGREVKVKIAERQPFPYGWCGARNDASMSLWVGGRKVFSRLEVTFSCAGERRGEIVVLNEHELTICQSFAADGAGYLAAPVRFECDDATRFLVAAQPDPVEYPPDDTDSPALGSMTIPFAEAIAFCQSFIGPKLADQSDDPWRNHALMVASATDAYHPEGAMRNVPPEAHRAPSFAIARFRFPDLAGEQPDFASITVAGYPPHWSRSRFDFDNDGDDDTVLVNSFRSGGFDGDIIQITSDQEDDALEEALHHYGKPATTHQGYLRPLMELLEGFSFTKYSGRFEGFSPDYADQYTYQHVFRADGETLVFAAPIYQRRRPTAIIYRPRPGGEADPVCVFQRVEENF